MPYCWKCWAGAFAATVVFCVLGVAYLDVPIAIYFQRGTSHWDIAGEVFSSPVLVGLITIVIAPLLLLRLVRGSLSDFAETVIVAGGTALGTFSVNDFVLKRMFGRQDVADFLADPRGAGFHLFGGDMNSSFPSGHAVMASAGLLVMARVYPRYLPPAVAALALIAILLLVGDWHFLSDIAAGLFLGTLAGTLAGDLAKSHFELKRARR